MERSDSAILMKKIQLTQKKWLQRFLRGSFWHSMGLIFSRALNLVLGFVLARMLGKQGFGTYGFFQTSVQKASAIAGLGLGLATTKHVAEFRSNPTRLGGVVTLAMLFVFVGGSSIGALMYLNADAIALRFDSKIDPPYVQLAGVTVLFAVVTLVFANVMSGLEAFRRNMLVQLCSSLVTFGLVVGAANWYGIDGAIKGLLLSLVFSASLYTAVVLYTLVQLKTVFSIKNAIAERSIILHYSMPSFLSGIVVVITDWIAESMVIIHAGFATYGLYVAANQFSMVITSLNGMFGATYNP